MRSNDVPWEALNYFVRKCAEDGVDASYTVSAVLEELPLALTDKWVRRRDTGERTVTLRVGPSD